jgi:hypothetical protein
LSPRRGVCNDDEFQTRQSRVGAAHAGDVTLSGFLQTKNGVTGQRTYIFRQVDPDGGPAIAQNGNTTIRVEPYGSRRLSPQNILNLRASEDLSLGGGRRLDVDVDVFNVLNAATPTSANFQSGPSFGYVINVIPARIARARRAFSVLMSIRVRGSRPHYV